MRKITALLLVLSMAVWFPCAAKAAGKSDIEGYAQKMIQYYYHYQTEAEDVIWDILNQMKQVDPRQAAAWENIMEDWAWVNDGMDTADAVLPEGLPQDDSLAIVVLGYQLNEEGKMQEELIDRLVVALSSALKYPNAWVVVSGGQTSQVKGATEAGLMSQWLQNRGIEKDRIIVEKQSLSTTANAVNVYKLLNKSYPQVTSMAVITSDYHIAWSCSMFAAVANYKSGYEEGRPIELVASAACETGGTFDSMLSQAWGVSQITGIPFDETEPKPVLYAVERPAETQPEETEPAEERKPAHHFFWEQAAEDEETVAATEKMPVLPVVLAAAVAAAVYVLIPKRPGKRKRREKPKMDWSDPE